MAMVWLASQTAPLRRRTSRRPRVKAATAANAANGKPQWNAGLKRTLATISEPIHSERGQGDEAKNDAVVMTSLLYVKPARSGACLLVFFAFVLRTKTKGDWRSSLRPPG
jgi:hypothetical protein